MDDIKNQELKTCGKCKIPKVISAFSKKGSGLQPWCRECNKTASRNYYAANPDKHVAAVMAAKAKTRRATLEFLRSYLATHPCVDCGEADIVVLEFDHRGDKRDCVCVLMRQGYPLETVKKEVLKCDVRCANCHRRKTYKHTWRTAPISGLV